MSWNQLFIALVADFMSCHSRLYRKKTGLDWGEHRLWLHVYCFLYSLARFPLYKRPQPRSSQIEFIASACIWIFILSVYVGTLLWVIPSEVFNTETRSKEVSSLKMTCLAMNTMVWQDTPLADTIHYRFYIVFIICSFVNAFFFWYFLPETKSIPLEPMNQGVWKPAKVCSMN